MVGPRMWVTLLVGLVNMMSPGLPDPLETLDTGRHQPWEHGTVIPSDGDCLPDSPFHACGYRRRAARSDGIPR